MIKIKSVRGGGDPINLTPQQRQEWNKYVDYIKSKGYSGSPLLDKKETGLATKLFGQFKAENPGVTLTLDHIGAVQQEMADLQKSSQAFAARHGDKNPANVMSGISKVDGWPGSRTTQFKFPEMQTQDYRNGSLVSQQNLGLVDSKLNPTGIIPSTTKILPKNAKLEKMADGKLYYEDPSTGSMVEYK